MSHAGHCTPWPPRVQAERRQPCVLPTWNHGAGNDSGPTRAADSLVPVVRCQKRLASLQWSISSGLAQGAKRFFILTDLKAVILTHVAKECAGPRQSGQHRERSLERFITLSAPSKRGKNIQGTQGTGSNLFVRFLSADEGKKLPNCPCLLFTKHLLMEFPTCSYTRKWLALKNI